MKKPSINKLKKKVWAYFSLYIRLKESDGRGRSVCVTCGIKKHYKKMQAGHFVQGRRNAVIFERSNVHTQCYGCNMCRHGALLEYWDYMEETYGRDEIKRLRLLNKNKVTFTPEDLKRLEKKYSKLCLKYLRRKR